MNTSDGICSSENCFDENSIGLDIPLVNIMLPNEWVLYLYDKQLFKKMVNKPNFQAKPYKELCSITTVNDMIYLLRLMEVPNGTDKKINMDTNDYIIMRKGIEPIWEDPKNSDGGTFSIKMDHNYGYEIWSTFVMYMLGETLTNEMENINGITVSYISDSNNYKNPEYESSYRTLEPITGKIMDYTLVKIWDRKSNRTLDQFINILPRNIIEKIQDATSMYSKNKEKNHFNESNIIAKLNNNRQSINKGRGGFITRGARNGRGRRY
jgi:hypothetical protein